MIDTVEIRCRILELAFAGKLSSHMNEDDSVEDMLLSNKIKSFDEEKGAPYDIPKHWKWVRLSELYDINPKVNANDSDDAAFVPMERISAGFNNTFSFEIQCWKQASNNHTKFMNGDVCFAKISPCFENRKSFVASDLPNSIGGGTTELIVLRQQAMNPLYTYYIVNDRRFIHDGSASYKGIVGQQRVKSDIIKNFLVPVPPYKEQSRIVETIKRIFQEIDKIDQYQSQYASDIKVLKNKLIDAAIRGKLTEQLPEDGDAEELYNQIQDEKARLIKAGKIKREKPSGDITEDEIPFRIPKNWKWVRWGDLSESIQYGYNAPAKESGRIKMVRISDIHDNKVEWENVPYCDISEEDISNYLLCENDILFARTGGTVGKSFLVKNVTEDAVYAGYLIRTRYNKKLVPEYMKYFMESQLYWNQLKKGTIATAQPNCNGKTLAKMILPLPPIAEQKRIVEKLEILLEQM